jgi:hypothetical protein
MILPKAFDARYSAWSEPDTGPHSENIANQEGGALVLI